MRRLLRLLIATLVCASSLPASAQVLVTIDAPKASALVGDKVSLSVTAMGPITRVEASLGTQTITLMESGPYTRVGELSLAGEPAGSKTIAVTAYDVNNVTTVRTVSIKLDRPPRILLDSPTYGAVVSAGTLSVQARCEDDGASACQLTSAPTVELTAAMEGQSKTVTVTATDSEGQTTSASVLIYVESSPRLREVVRAASGEVLDFDGTRALVRSEDLRSVTMWTATSGPTLVYQGLPEVIRGQLYAQGALVVTRNQSEVNANSAAYTWDSTSGLTMVGLDAEVAGTWMAIKKNVPRPPPVPSGSLDSAGNTLALRDLTTGSQVFETPTTAGGYIGEFEVSPNGDLLWGPVLTLSLTLRRGGVTSNLEGDSRPLGELLIDERYATGRYAASASSTIYLYTNAGREVLCRTASGRCPSPFLASGWLGYGLREASLMGATTRLFRRNPLDSIEELTGFGPTAEISAMNGAGEVMVTSSNRRLFGGKDGFPVDISSSLGRTVYKDGWYLLLGRSVFSIDTSPGGNAWDAGVPKDGGAGATEQLDAGMPSSLQDASAGQVADGGIPSGTQDAAAGAASLDGSTADTSHSSNDSGAGPNDSGESKGQSDGCAVAKDFDARHGLQTWLLCCGVLLCASRRSRRAQARSGERR